MIFSYLEPECFNKGDTVVIKFVQLGSPAFLTKRSRVCCKKKCFKKIQKKEKMIEQIFSEDDQLLWMCGSAWILICYVSIYCNFTEKRRIERTEWQIIVREKKEERNGTETRPSKLSSFKKLTWRCMTACKNGELFPPFLSRGSKA